MIRALPAVNKPFIALTASPNLLTCSWLERNKKDILLRAYEVYETNSLLVSSAIFNQSQHVAFLRRFLEKNKIKNADSALCLKGFPVAEEIVKLSNAFPKASDFGAHIPQTSSKNFAYRYLFPVENNHFAFYVCTIPHYMLFQYQLCTLMAGLQLRGITTEFDALAQVYNRMQGHVKRQQDMATHMREVPYFSALVSPQLCAQVVRFAPGLTLDLRTQAASIMQSCGLLYAGEL